MHKLTIHTNIHIYILKYLHTCIHTGYLKAKNPSHLEPQEFAMVMTAS